uniref:Uncharacterized protein n=1 Tax=Cannabis sativa TaxID=3483 RepID=A0A803NG13_CANSA
MVRIRKDAWICKDHVSRAYSFRGGSELEYVSDLKLENGMWNVPLVRKLFDEDAQSSSSRTVIPNGLASVNLSNATWTVELELGDANLFVDLGVNVKGWKISLGAVVMSQSGEVFYSGAVLVAVAYEPHLAETVALLQEMILCRRLGYITHSLARIILSLDTAKVWSLSLPSGL